MHKVERPALVRPERQRHRRANPNGALAAAASPHHQPLFFVQPVNPLAVDRVTLAPQQHPKASMAKPPALLSQRFQPLAQPIVIAPPVPVYSHGRQCADNWRPSCSCAAKFAGRMASNTATGALSRTRGLPAGAWCSGTCCTKVLTSEPPRFGSGSLIEFDLPQWRRADTAAPDLFDARPLGRAHS